MLDNKVLADDDTKKTGQGMDNSLRGKAMRRALRQQVPKTLTPHEWEQWYAEHGMPEAHRRVEKDPPERWWPPCNWLRSLNQV